MDWLDELVARVYLERKARVNKSQIIRAVLDAVAASGMDLSDCGSEAEIRVALTVSRK